jgi:hypothetical protein
MRKLFIYASAFMCIFVSVSEATEIIWSEATVFLDTLSFTNVSGDANVSFAESPQGTLVSRNVVRYDDIVECGPGVDCDGQEINGINYVGGEELGWNTIVEKQYAINTTGSGEIVFSFDAFWEYDAFDWAMPDANFSNPNAYFWAYLDDICVYGWDISNYTGNSNFFHGRDTFFLAAEEFTTFTLLVQTAANGMWENMPESHHSTSTEPIPEPATITMTFFGIIGYLLRSKFSKG